MHCVQTAALCLCLAPKTRTSRSLHASYAPRPASPPIAYLLTQAKAAHRRRGRDAVNGAARNGPKGWRGCESWHHFVLLGMPTPRHEEVYAAACIESALPATRVRQHDDGSQPSMYDFSLMREGRQVGACEVTAVADAAAIELWNLVNGSEETWTDETLVGGWLVMLQPMARARELKANLPRLLGMLENRGIAYSQRAIDVDQALRGMGIVSTRQSATSVPGSIYLTIAQETERIGGWVSERSEGLVPWLNDWLVSADQAHNLQKLAQADVDERHLCILFPGFTTAPFDVVHELMRDDVREPATAPTLPPPLTHVWMISGWDTGSVLTYSPDGWRVHPKPSPAKWAP